MHHLIEISISFNFYIMTMYDNEFVIFTGLYVIEASQQN